MQASSESDDVLRDADGRPLYSAVKKSTLPLVTVPQLVNHQLYETTDVSEKVLVVGGKMWGGRERERERECVCVCVCVCVCMCV